MIPKDAAVWLYGSHARSDPDEMSDLDVLIVVSTTWQQVTVENWVRQHRSDWCATVYTWDELRGMARYGSLFLHHLRVEGKPLGTPCAQDTRLRKILDATGPYRRAVRDVASFRTTLADTYVSVHDGGSIHYELSTLATVLRHSAILGCYLQGEPTFGRVAPVEVITHRWGLAGTWPAPFAELYRYRLAAAGRCPNPPKRTPAYFARWHGATASFLEVLARRARNYERALPTAAA